MIIHFVRHGQTAHNRDGLGLGRADVPLTDLGMRQAAAVAAYLADEPISHIYTSPLQRCQTVASAIAGERGIPVEAREELIELDVGETEGLSFPVIRERHPRLLEDWAGPEGHLYQMPGGERLADVEERVMPFLRTLQETRPHDSVVIVSHNFVIRLAIVRLLGLEIPAFRSVVAGVSSISTLRLREGGGVVLRKLNDMCAVRDLES